MRFTGTDEVAIIKVLASNSSEQRQKIKEKYRILYGKVSTTCTKAQAKFNTLEQEEAAMWPRGNVPPFRESMADLRSMMQWSII